MKQLIEITSNNPNPTEVDLMMLEGKNAVWNHVAHNTLNEIIEETNKIHKENNKKRHNILVRKH